MANAKPVAVIGSELEAYKDGKPLVDTSAQMPTPDNMDIHVKKIHYGVYNAHYKDQTVKVNGKYLIRPTGTAGASPGTSARNPSTGLDDEDSPVPIGYLEITTIHKYLIKKPKPKPKDEDTKDSDSKGGGSSSSGTKTPGSSSGTKGSSTGTKSGSTSGTKGSSSGTKHSGSTTKDKDDKEDSDDEYTYELKVENEYMDVWDLYPMEGSPSRVYADGYPIVTEGSGFKGIGIHVDMKGGGRVSSTSPITGKIKKSSAKNVRIIE